MVVERGDAIINEIRELELGSDSDVRALGTSMID
jgi:hypothetical protein